MNRRGVRLQQRGKRSRIGQRRCARMCTYASGLKSHHFGLTLQKDKNLQVLPNIYISRDSWGSWFILVFMVALFFFLVCFLNIFSNNSQKWVFVNTLRWKSWWRRPQCWVSFFSWCVDNLHILISTVSPSPDPFEAFVIFSIRHEIRRIDLHKRDYSLLVPGLRNTIALDFHFNHSLLYWTDVVEDKIYRGKLSESGGMLSHCQ